MKILRKISSVVIAALLVFSSMSFTINKHICMGQIKSISLFTDASECNMASEVPPCSGSNDDHQKENHFQKQACCASQSLVVEGQTEMKEVAAASLPDLQCIAVLYAFVSAPTAESRIYADYREYTPPLIERDIPVFVQSFLI